MKLFLVLKGCFNKHGCNVMSCHVIDGVRELATIDLLKIKVFWKKGCDVITFDYDVTNKIISRESNYAVDVVVWPMFGNSSNSMKKLSWPQFYKNLSRKTEFCEGCSWFKFNNLGLALDMALRFYRSVEKGLKPKFWRLILTFAQITGEKAGRRAFLPTPPQ